MTEYSLKLYLFESGCCLLVFYLFFYLFLKKETFFRANRVYLLLTPFLSFFIPLLNIEIYRSSIPQELEIFFPYVIGLKSLNLQLLSQLNRITSGAYFSLSDILLLLYLVGVLMMISRLIIKLATIVRWVRRGKRRPYKGYILVEAPQPMPVASFFHFLFWNVQIKEEEQTYILQHELAHIRQGHSFDNLIIECYLILRWFDPILWLFKRDIRINHEFLADEAVTKNMATVFPYAKVMVNHSTDNPAFSVFSAFASKIKQRLLMLNQPTTEHWKAIKYFMLIPLLFGLMAFFSLDLIYPEDL